MSRPLDVIVVGAGFAGLSAAKALGEKGLSFRVLEARNRVGGRVEAKANGLGEHVDTGGQFLCDDMPELLALARTRGIRLVETQLDGTFLTQPPMDAFSLDACYAASMALRERIALVAADDGQARMSVAAWLARQPESEEARAAFRAMIEGLWCVALEDLPVWYLASNDRRVTNEAPELQYLLDGTMHGLARRLGADLGGNLQLATPVVRIERTSAQVRVLTETRDTGITARAALVALPPVTAARLTHAPALPRPVAWALSAWRSGTVIKVLVRYARPFWREQGLSGMVAWRHPSGLFAFDASPDAEHAMLAFFVGGPLALEWHGREEEGLRAAVIDWLGEALGPEARQPLDITIRDWTEDRWSGGAYSDVVADMEATDAEDLLRAGAPPVFFTCSELSPSFPGYIEGAIVAGRLAADEVAAYLAGQAPIAISASGS